MLSIIIGLIALIVLSYRGYSIIVVAPISALIVALGHILTQGAAGSLANDLLLSYTGTYMQGLGSFLVTWFPIFLLGALFGKIMEVTNEAKSVAHFLVNLIGKKQAILAIVLSCAVLTYGGVSLFVAVFAVYPIALALFREANLPRRLIPAVIALGSFTFTMTAIPGTPQIQNLIPGKYFHTDSLAAPILGIVAALIMGVGGYLWLVYRKNKLVANGEHFDEIAQSGKIVDEESKATIDTAEKVEGLPNPYLSFLPLLTVIVTFNAFKINLILALLIGTIVAGLINLKEFKKFASAIADGANGAVMAIFNTSAAVGFGAVVRSVPGFTDLSNFLVGIKGTPLISEAISVTALAGATGSASGGMGIALAALGEKYYQLALELGINPEIFHRVASVASGGLDTLPHNGAVLTLLAVTAMTHKKSYFDIFIVSLVIPLVATIAIIMLGSMGIA